MNSALQSRNSRPPKTDGTATAGRAVEHLLLAGSSSDQASTDDPLAMADVDVNVSNQIVRGPGVVTAVQSANHRRVREALGVKGERHHRVELAVAAGGRQALPASAMPDRWERTSRNAPCPC